MRAVKLKNNCLSGFTLLEIIITMSIAAFLSTILFHYMGTSLTRSSEPVIEVQKNFIITQIIEKITADYRILVIDGNTSLNHFKTIVENGNDENNSPFYGNYLVNTKFISFNNINIENAAPCVPADSCDILKVEITAADHTIQTLFARRIF